MRALLLEELAIIAGGLAFDTQPPACKPDGDINEDGGSTIAVGVHVK